MTEPTELLEALDQGEHDFLQWAADTLKEINLSNYDHDDVCCMNNASVEVILAIQARLAPRSGDGALRALIEELRGEPGNCPFCKCDPYEYVDNGVGMEKVAVVCCDAGIGLFQHGDKQLVDEVNLRNRAAAAIEALTGSSAEPITEEWLKACGWEGNLAVCLKFKVDHYRTLYLYPVDDDKGMRVYLYRDPTNVYLRNITTRDQLRALFEALTGMEWREGK